MIEMNEKTEQIVKCDRLVSSLICCVLELIETWQPGQ